MKNTLTFLHLFLLSSHALAEWTMIQTHDTGTMYLDFDTLEKHHDFVSISTLNDYHDMQKRGELSSQWKELHDCKNKRFKALSINHYTENLGNGKQLLSLDFNESETAWSETVPYSAGELKANIICSR
ncbi:MAG: hypothetical protein HOP21_00370 [Methylotenera sp.]|nr:hypothetical protein [Methylotenera sp.]